MRYEMDSGNVLNTLVVLSFITAYELLLHPYHYCDIFLYTKRKEKLYFDDKKWMNFKTPVGVFSSMPHCRANLVLKKDLNFVIVNKTWEEIYVTWIFFLLRYLNGCWFLWQYIVNHQLCEVISRHCKSFWILKKTSQIHTLCQNIPFKYALFKISIRT